MHTGAELHESHDAWRFGLKMVNYMRDVVDEYSQGGGTYFGLVQSPAESASVRLAQIDLKRYGPRAIVQGERSRRENGSPAVYYTNSSHMNVDAAVPLGQSLGCFPVRSNAVFATEARPGGISLGRSS